MVVIGMCVAEEAIECRKFYYYLLSNGKVPSADSGGGDYNTHRLESVSSLG